MAKQFALLVACYLDAPPLREKYPASHIPLENMFRLLEMYLFDGFGEKESDTLSWKTRVASALQNARLQTYPEQPKDVAIAEIQEVLRSLTRFEALNVDEAKRVKSFFMALYAELP